MGRYLLLLLVNMLFIAQQLNAASTDMITQREITWTFDQAYEYGQFANGDYWVVGPVTIIGITPESIEASGRIMNGSMLNPSTADSRVGQGYDSSCQITYSSALNVAFNVSPSSPLVLQNGSSLVSTISAVNSRVTPQLRAAEILTVLTSAPPEGSFRPSYSGTDKTVRFNISQLNYNLLGSLAPVANTPSLSMVERYFERPWIDHQPGWTGRILHPGDNMPNYGREVARNLGVGALMLHLDFTNEQKETLLIRFVQVGIDLYGIVQSGGIYTWRADGGHCNGRKWPILFAGLMLNDADMRNIGQKSGQYLYSGNYGPANIPADYVHFSEDDQTFYVSKDDVERTNSSSWNPDLRGGTPEPYTASDIGMPEWGIVHAHGPDHDNKAWNAIYRQCCTTLALPGHVLSCRIMEAQCGIKALWNYNPFFDYQDRYMVVTADDGSNPGWRSWDVFTENMWDAYRVNYGPVHCPITCSGVAGNGKVDLSWAHDTRNAAVVGCNIYRSTDGGKNYAKVGSVAGTSYSDRGLVAGTTCNYQLRAYDNNGESYPAIVNVLVTEGSLPPIPSSLAASAVSVSRVYLSWTDNGLNEEEFRIERSQNGIDFTEIGQTGPNVSAYADSGLTNNTPYYYRVRAYNAVGYSGYSNVLQVETSNTKPSITPVAWITCFEGEKIEFDLAVTDVNPPDTITLTPSQALPEGSTLTPGNNRTWRFLWQTDFTDAGVYTLAFTANDGSADSDPVNVNITVNEVSSHLQVTNHTEWN